MSTTEENSNPFRTSSGPSVNIVHSYTTLPTPEQDLIRTRMQLTTLQREAKAHLDRARAAMEAASDTLQKIPVLDSVVGGKTDAMKILLPLRWETNSLTFSLRLMCGPFTVGMVASDPAIDGEWYTYSSITGDKLQYRSKREAEQSLLTLVISLAESL